MTSLILVTGGTGTLGKLVVPRLREAGAKVRVLSRQAREDSRTATWSTSAATWTPARESTPRWPGRRSSCTARARRRATGTRPAPWSGPRPGPGRPTW